MDTADHRGALIEILAPPTAPSPSSKPCLISSAPLFFTVGLWRPAFLASGFTMIDAITAASNVNGGKPRFIAYAAINFTALALGLNYAHARVADMKTRV